MEKQMMNIIDILEGCYALCCCIGVFYFRMEPTPSLRMEPTPSLRILLLVISTIGILATGLARRKMSIGSGLAAIWNVYFIIGFF